MDTRNRLNALGEQKPLEQKYTQIETFEELLQSQINGNISWSIDTFNQFSPENKRDFINWLWNNSFEDKVLWFCQKYFEDQI